MLSTSCLSTKTTEYKVIVPTLNFPEFPEADSITENKSDNTCTVPSLWIVQLSLFRIRYDALVETYNFQKETIEGKTKGDTE